MIHAQLIFRQILVPLKFSGLHLLQLLLRRRRRDRGVVQHETGFRGSPALRRRLDQLRDMLQVAGLNSVEEGLRRQSGFLDDKVRVAFHHGIFQCRIDVPRAFCGAHGPLLSFRQPSLDLGEALKVGPLALLGILPRQPQLVFF